MSDPSGLALSVAAETGCDLDAARASASAYFLDGGVPSLENAALDFLDVMEAACAADDAATYTAGWYDLARVIELGLETGVTGAPGDGNDLLSETLQATLPSGGPAFHPCGGAPDCETFDPDLAGPASSHPDFTSALSPGGAWAVITTGTSAVCSGHRAPCANIDPDPAADGDVWGVEPSATWELALHGRTTLLWGAPISGPSPTGEALLATPIPAYEFNLSPNPQEFLPNATPPAVLEVGLCSIALTGIDETLVQKNTTVLQQAFLSFCPSQTASAGADERQGSWLGRLARALFDPLPRPLFATAFLTGPGGTAGNFTDFYAIDLPQTGTWAFPNPPADAAVGATLLGSDGNPVKVKAITTSMASPLERAQARIVFVNNNGLIPSGNVVRVDPNATTNLTCSQGVCTGVTQADQEAEPGVLEVPVQITKPGAYRMCVTGTLPPLDLSAEVCSPKFNVRP
ncbi:MAG: hypothetical protein R3266_13490 [Gemmatimonadota bacterium]|nr:hypothetical protein [Gemmatimonadota bacterium]